MNLRLFEITISFAACALYEDSLRGQQQQPCRSILPAVVPLQDREERWVFRKLQASEVVSTGPTNFVRFANPGEMLKRILH